MSYSGIKKFSVNDKKNKNAKQISKIESKLNSRPDWDDSINNLSSLRATPHEMLRRHLIHQSHNNVSNKNLLDDLIDSYNQLKNINKLKRSQSNPNLSSNKMETTSISINDKISVMESMHKLYSKLSSNNCVDGNQTRPHFLAMMVKFMEDIDRRVDELSHELKKEKSLRLQLENKVHSQEIIIEELIKDLLRANPLLRDNVIKNCMEI